MELKQVIVVRKDLNMRKGKMSAQAAHASLMAIAPRGGFWGRVSRLSRRLFGLHIAPCNRWTADWLNDSWTKIVVGAADAAELEAVRDAAISAGLQVFVCKDAGRTEFAGVPTVTCISIGPAPAEKFASVTDRLPLL